MRNLAEYPIDLDEIYHVLTTMAQDLEKEGRIGDMRPLILRTAIRIIKRAEFVTHGIGFGL